MVLTGMSHALATRAGGAPSAGAGARTERGPMVRDGGGASYDPEAVHAKYVAERDKRLVPGRSDIRDLTADEHFAAFRQDPFTPFVPRDAITDDVDVVIVGG